MKIYDNFISWELSSSSSAPEYTNSNDNGNNNNNNNEDEDNEDDNIENTTATLNKLYNMNGGAKSSLEYCHSSFKTSSSSSSCLSMNRLTFFDNKNIIRLSLKPVSLLPQRPMTSSSHNMYGIGRPKQQSPSSTLIRVFSSNSTSNINNNNNNVNNDDNDNNNGDSGSDSGDNILIDNGDRIKCCWKCDKPLHENRHQSNATNGSNTQVLHNDNNNDVIIKCPHCSALQPISKNVDYFQLFNLNSMVIANKQQQPYWNYDIDLEKLRRNYLRLQQNMHPDMNINRSNIESEFSSTNSSIINDGYKILRDPYQRALYMLRLMFNIIIDEVNMDSEPNSLLEIMELNEEIELAHNDPDSLRVIMEQLKENMEKLMQNLTIAFNDLNASEARTLTIKYSYYNNAMAKLKSSL
ncbi:hypothetical protein DERF_002646 [Dermatophagoides farinae]|uniref:J domain-containing protein n=1 Tax=Dermatophagoides farinae TaxID=6954 RepID=A0A922LAT9_DERFA|nr:hypothetical protein DERF_002646 [Dermatophagoides farinae]